MLTPEEELWKRAFWFVKAAYLRGDWLTQMNRALVSIDRVVSPAMGQPCSIQDQEYGLFMFS